MKSWTFENIDWLWALTGVQLIVVILIVRRLHQQRQFNLLGGKEALKQLMPDFSPARWLLKHIFLILGFSSLVVALTNPQITSKLEKVKVKGAEIIIALDVSNSMLADDMQPSRLEKARLEIGQLLKNMKTDRIGLIVFAGKAFIPVPLTTDYAMIKMYLKGIDTDIISTQGTDIGGAIALASESFSEDAKSEKALILITDGENHEEDAINNAEEASENGITIHTIGLGKKEGVPIPFFDRYGRKGFKRDQNGNMIVSKLNEQLLNDIAAAGKGQYVHASNYGFGLDRIYKQLQGLEKAEFAEKVMVVAEDDFQFYLWLALLFLTIEFLILPRKNKYLSRINIGNVKV